QRTQPPADVSAMDGYAARAADLANAPARLKVVGEVAAGRPFDRAIGAGEAARIFTGGVMPAGAPAGVVQGVTPPQGDGVWGGEGAGQRGRAAGWAGWIFGPARSCWPRAIASPRATSRSSRR